MRFNTGKAVSFRGLVVGTATSLFIGLIPTATLAISAQPASAATAGTINTIAGTATVGFSGDGGPASSAQIDGPTGVAYDAGGNLYFADELNHRVRKINAAGVISTIAGNGATTFSGDGGPATDAGLDPWGLATDGAGNVYVADSANARVRKISTSGVITTVAGSSAQFDTGDGGPATSAGLSLPVAVTLDGAGNLYIADANGNDGHVFGYPGPINDVVRKVDAATGNISTLATFSSIPTPHSLAADAQGNLFVLESYYNGQVFRIDHATSAVTVVAGNGDGGFSGDGGVATAASFSAPMDIALDGAGALYIADDANHRVRRVDPTSDIVTTIAGTGSFGYSGDGGPASAAKFRGPLALAVNRQNGDVVIVDTDTYADSAPGHLENPQGSNGSGDHIRLISALAASGPVGVGPTGPPPPPVGGPPTAGELLGNGSNPDEVCFVPTQGCQGDPVDTGTGNFSHTWSDLAIPGRGVRLSLSRTYNSGAATTDSAFGFGWSYDYGMSLTINGSTVTVNNENGSQATFTNDGTGHYTAPPRAQATLVKNGDGTYTFTRRNKSIFTFDSSGNLSAGKDLNGYITTITRPSPTSTLVTDPAGRTLSFTLNANHITGLTDPLGRTESFTYDASGNLTDVIDFGGGHWQFTYDAAHRMLTMRSPKFFGDTSTSPSPVTTNHYDAQGRVDSQTDPLGRTTAFDYTSIPGSTKVTDPKGNVSVDTYQYGLRTAATKGYGTSIAATSTFAYDPNTLGLIKVTDPVGHTTTMTYDQNGNRTSITDALGHLSSATYNALNDQTSATDPNGVTTTATYDSAGNLLSKSTPINGSSATTTFTYGDSTHPGDLTKITDPNSHPTTKTYDRYGNVASSTDAIGDKTTFTYNTDGWMLTKVAPRGNVTGANAAAFTTTYDHDNFGRVTATKDPLWSAANPSAHRTTTAYDANGNVTSSTDGNGQTTTYSYDPSNQQTAVTKPDGTVLASAYWPDGTLKTQVDGNGDITTYAYDALGRLTTQTDPLNRVTTYSYDAAGNLTGKADAGGSCGSTPLLCTTYSYDAANRMTGVTYSDGTVAISYVYDSKGQRTSMTDGAGTTTNTWDSLGRLTNQTNGTGTAVSYSYDKVGNLTGLVYPGNHSVTRTYDSADRLTAVSDWLGHTNRFTYDPNSNETSSLAANGVADAGTFDNADQLNALSIAKGSVANITYARNGAGQLTSSASTGALNQPTETYGYDQNSRLSSVNGSSLTYDHADNITKTQDQATQAYDSASQLTSRTIGGVTTTYGYDTGGNRTSATTSGQTTTLGYDLADRMKSYAKGTTSATYVYDGDGNRTSKTVNGTTANFVYDNAEGLSQILSDGTNSYIYGPGGMPIEQVNGSAVTYLHQDQLGSTRVLTDQNRNVVGTYTYGAYGTTTAHTGTGSTPLQYAGQYLDSESSMYWMRARYYDPTTAQFVSVDPAVNQTRSTYGYASGDPLNQTDPNGLGLCITFLSSNCTSIAAQHPEISQQIVNVSAGVVNGITLGHANDVFGALGESGYYNQCSSLYGFGTAVGVGVDFGLAGKLLEAAGSVGQLSDSEAIGILRDAVKGKGNFGLGEASAGDADALGEAWVGSGARLASDGKTLVSQDGLRQYRPPSYKPGVGKTQANFESRQVPQGQWQSNGHLDISGQ